ncbi:MAG TPA: hypothetical protein DHV28_18025 [Ignavibacteriales bacterium]|nr:hypothetical protein [Ignavibacteriales bacterium]
MISIQFWFRYLFSIKIFNELKILDAIVSLSAVISGKKKTFLANSKQKQNIKQKLRTLFTITKMDQYRLREKHLVIKCTIIGNGIVKTE